MIRHGLVVIAALGAVTSSRPCAAVAAGTATATAAASARDGSVLATPDDSQTDRFALVVGLNEASDGSRAPLRFADDDAARFFELLAPVTRQAHLLTVFDADSQTAFGTLVSSARAPTRRTWTRTLESLRIAIAESHAQGRQAELFLYWAGHGDIDDGVGFVHLVDGRLTRPEFRAEVLEGLGADRAHIVIDACKSYYLVAGRGPGGRREPQPTAFAGPDPIPGVGYVLSTSSDAEAHEWAALHGGVFSHEVRSGLLGAADADRDGRIDYAELGAFISTANAAIPVPAFRPSVYVRPPMGAGAASIYSPSALGRSAQLRIPLERAGRLRITDARGYRYLDANKPAGVALSVRLLQPQSYEVEFDGVRRRVPAGAGAVDLASLVSADVLVAERGQVHRAFEHLFELPFGSQVVQGYRLAARDYDKTTRLTSGRPPAASRWRLPLLISGFVLVAGGAALSVVSATTRGSIATAAQVDRDGLATRADVFLGTSLVSYGLGLGAVGAGLFVFDSP